MLTVIPKGNTKKIIHNKGIKMLTRKFVCNIKLDSHGGIEGQKWYKACGKQIVK